MDILSTIKGEYTRTILLIIVPGAISFFPFFSAVQDYIGLLSIDSDGLYHWLTYLFFALLFGFIIQDIGARIETALDFHYCKRKKRVHSHFSHTFTRYLFNEKHENFIITGYYRGMLIRLKFELHMIAAILLLWVGMVFNACIGAFNINLVKTLLFVAFTVGVFIYLLYEAYSGVGALHYYRTLINKRFKPEIQPDNELS